MCFCVPFFVCSKLSSYLLNLTLDFSSATFIFFGHLFCLQHIFVYVSLFVNGNLLSIWKKINIFENIGSFE